VASTDICVGMSKHLISHINVCSEICQLVKKLSVSTKYITFSFFSFGSLGF
jgi:hypothetical protein